MIQSYSNTDPYWAQVANIMAQVEGLHGGYSHTNPGDSRLQLIDTIMLGAWGDIMEIFSALDRQSRPDWGNMTLEQIRMHFAKNGHCSALIKTAPDLSWLISGHASWFTYTFTLRILKVHNGPERTCFWSSSNQTPSTVLRFASRRSHCIRQSSLLFLSSSPFEH